MTVYDQAAPRSARRAASRDKARKQAKAYFAFVGLAPLHEPARNHTCSQHHRKLPCRRCREAGTE
jgi:hypothetical protein